MSSKTTNLELVKPAIGEPVKLSTFNGNMEILDTAYLQVANRVSAITNAEIDALFT